MLAIRCPTLCVQGFIVPYQLILVRSLNQLLGVRSALAVNGDGRIRVV